MAGMLNNKQNIKKYFIMLNLGANITNCAKYLVKDEDFFSSIFRIYPLSILFP
jgi:hypothetical protein